MSSNIGGEYIYTHSSRELTLHLLLASIPITYVFMVFFFLFTIPFLTITFHCKHGYHLQLILHISFFLVYCAFSLKVNFFPLDFFYLPKKYCIFSKFVFFPDRLPVYQYGIYFTGIKQIHEYLIQQELCGPFLFNGWQIMANIIVFISIIMVEKVVEEWLTLLTHRSEERRVSRVK